MRRWAKFLTRVLAGVGAAALFRGPVPAQQRGVGTIAYTHAPDGGDPWPVNDIYSIGADGSNRKILTHDGHSHDPSWSPDGRRILFIHDAALRTAPAYREEKGFESYHPVELYVMDADGGNRHLLRRLEPVIYYAAWSPDGKTIAIACIPETWVDHPPAGGEPMRAGLFLLPANGEGEPRLLVRGAFTPAWSPDGKRLAYSLEQPRGQWAVHVVNADGSHDVQLTDSKHTAGSPAWSPDGKSIAYDEFVERGPQQVFVMEADGSHARQLTSNPNWTCLHPSWSPDGRRLAFSCISAAAPRGGISSAGTVLPPCTRRLFILSMSDAESRPTEIDEHDGTFPAFAPAP